jgi:tetratricopeptide (TPR) repeat protein
MDVVRPYMLVMAALLAAGAGSAGAADDVALAEQAYRDGFYDVAARQFEDVLAAHPLHGRSNEVRVLLGRCYFELGALSNSLARLQAVKAGGAPGALYAEAQYWSGRIYELTGDPPKALFSYEAAASVQPSSEFVERASFAAARLYLKRKDTAQARLVLSNCLHGAQGGVAPGEILFLLSQCAMVDGVPGEATRLLAQALDDETNAAFRPMLQCGMAVADLAGGRTNEAYKAFSALAVADASASVRAIAQLYAARGALAQGATNQARTQLDAVLGVPRGQDTAALSLFAADGFPWADAQFLAAQLDLDARKTAEARAAYEDVVSNYPSSSVAERAALGAALASVLMGDVGRATQHLCRLAATASPEVRIQSLFQLGDLARGSSNHPAALDAYAAVLAQASNMPAGAEALLRTGMTQYEQASYGLAQKTFGLVAAPPRLKAEALYWSAWCMIEQGQPADARAAFTNYLALFPADQHAADVRLNLARLACQMGDYTAALENYTRIVSNAEDAVCAARADYELGWVYTSLGRRDDAIAQFARLVTTYSNSPLCEDVQYYLGETFFNLNDYERAKGAFGKVAERYPTSSFAAASAYWAGVAAFRLGRSDECALVLSAHWARIMTSAEAPAALLLKGDCCRARKAWSDALDAYRAAQERATSSFFAVEAVFRTSEILMDISNAAAAVAVLTPLAAHEHALTRARAWLALGDAKHASGDDRGALAEWFRVIYDGREFTALYNQAIDRAGRLYETLGETERSRQVFRRRAEEGAAPPAATNAPPTNAPAAAGLITTGQHP